MEDLLYVSTRGNGGETNFCGTVLEGQCTDGGLFVPKVIPILSSSDFKMMVGLPYYHVAAIVLHKLAPDIPFPKLWDMIRAVYQPTVFKNVSTGDYPEDIVPVKELLNNLYLVRLSNGPTLAFKDIGLQLLGYLFEYLLNGTTMNILGATSGDTGTAAIYSMRPRAGINTFMLSPESGMSAFQASHMWGIDDPSIHNIAIIGSFDDGQKVVKSIFSDIEFKQKYNLGAINSINWARIAAQVVYYVYAYSRVQGGSGNLVDFTIPTGNFGNLFAGFIAREMGTPIRNLVLATNENDVLYGFFKYGIYKPREKTIVTASPSMDITAASNFERYVYYLLNGDSEQVVSLWNRLKTKDMFNLRHILKRVFASSIVSESVSERKSFHAMCQIRDTANVIIDPHTSVAMFAAQMNRDSAIPMLVLETAQPCKFDETVKKVLGSPAPRPDAFVGIESTERKYTSMEPKEQLIREYIKEHA